MSCMNGNRAKFTSFSCERIDFPFYYIIRIKILPSLLSGSIYPSFVRMVQGGIFIGGHSIPHDIDILMCCISRGMPPQLLNPFTPPLLLQSAEKKEEEESYYKWTKCWSAEEVKCEVWEILMTMMKQICKEVDKMYQAIRTHGHTL